MSSPNPLQPEEEYGVDRPEEDELEKLAEAEIDTI